MDDGDSRPSIETRTPQGNGGRLVVEIVDDDGDWSGFGDARAAVETASRLVAEATEIALGPSAATVALSSDAVVRDLNRAYRGKDKPTNVLSFPAPPAPRGARGGRTMLGDIVLAVETIAAEARALGIPPRHHLQHLVVHGLLHLAGYDHETDEDAAEMEALETRLLARIGIDDPDGEPAA